MSHKIQSLGRCLKEKTFTNGQKAQMSCKIKPKLFKKIRTIVHRQKELQRIKFNFNDRFPQTSDQPQTLQKSQALIDQGNRTSPLHSKRQTRNKKALMATDNSPQPRHAAKRTKSCIGIKFPNTEQRRRPPRTTRHPSIRNTARANPTRTYHKTHSRQACRAQRIISIHPVRSTAEEEGPVAEEHREPVTTVALGE